MDYFTLVNMVWGLLSHTESWAFHFLFFISWTTSTNPLRCHTKTI